MRYDVKPEGPEYRLGVYKSVKAFWRTFGCVIPYHLIGGGLLIVQAFFFLAFFPTADNATLFLFECNTELRIPPRPIQNTLYNIP